MAPHIDPTFDHRINAWEGTVGRALEAHFSRAERVALEKLTGAKSRKRYEAFLEAKATHVPNDPAHEPIPEDDNTSIDRNAIFDAVAFAARLVEDAYDWIKGIFIDFGGSTSDHLNASFDPADPSISLAAYQQAQRISNVAMTTAKSLDRTITQGEANGESLEQIAQRVKDEFETTKTVRIPLIATTEVMSAANTASFQAAFQSGLPIRKTWITMGDKRVRDEHQDMQLVTVNLRDPFMVPTGDGYEWPMDHPGDPTAPIGLVIRCRCRLAYTPVTTEQYSGKTAFWRSRTSQLGTETVKVRKKHPRPKAASVAIVSRQAYREAWNPKPQNWPDVKAIAGGDGDGDGWADDGKPTMHWVGIKPKLKVVGEGLLGVPVFPQGILFKKKATAYEGWPAQGIGTADWANTPEGHNAGYNTYMLTIKDEITKAAGKEPKNATEAKDGWLVKMGYNDRQAASLKANTYARWAIDAVDTHLGKPPLVPFEPKPHAESPVKPLLGDPIDITKPLAVTTADLPKPSWWNGQSDAVFKDIGDGVPFQQTQVTVQLNADDTHSVMVRVDGVKDYIGNGWEPYTSPNAYTAGDIASIPTDTIQGKYASENAYRAWIYTVTDDNDKKWSSFTPQQQLEIRYAATQAATAVAKATDDHFEPDAPEVAKPSLSRPDLVEYRKDGDFSLTAGGGEVRFMYHEPSSGNVPIAYVETGGTSSWTYSTVLEQPRVTAQGIAKAFGLNSQAGNAAYNAYMYSWAYSPKTYKEMSPEERDKYHQVSELNALAAGITVQGGDTHNLWATFHLPTPGTTDEAGKPGLAPLLRDHGPHVATGKPHYDAVHKVVTGILPNDSNGNQRVIPTTELLPAWGDAGNALTTATEYNLLLQDATNQATDRGYEKNTPQWYAYVNAYTAGKLIKKSEPSNYIDPSYAAKLASSTVLNVGKPDENQLKFSLPMVTFNVDKMQPVFDTETGLVHVNGLGDVSTFKNDVQASSYDIQPLKTGQLTSAPTTAAAQFAAKNTYMGIIKQGTPPSANPSSYGGSWVSQFNKLPADDKNALIEAGTAAADKVAALVEASEKDNEPTNKVVPPLDVSKWPDTIQLPKYNYSGHYQVPTKGGIKFPESIPDGSPAAEDITNGATGFIATNYPDLPDPVKQAAYNAYLTGAAAMYDKNQSTFTMEDEGRYQAKAMIEKLQQGFHPVPDKVLLEKTNYYDNFSAATFERDKVDNSEARKKANIFVASLGPLTPYESNAAYNAYTRTLFNGTDNWLKGDATAQANQVTKAEGRARKAVSEVQRIQRPPRPTVLDSLDTPTISGSGIKLPDGTWVPGADGSAKMNIDPLRYPKELELHFDKESNFYGTARNAAVIHAFEMSGGNWDNFTSLDDDKKAMFLEEVDHYGVKAREFIGTPTEGVLHQPPLVERSIAKSIKTVKKQKTGALLPDAGLESMPSISAYLAKGGRPDPNIKSRTGKSHALLDAFVEDLQLVKAKGVENGVDANLYQDASIPNLGGMPGQVSLNNSDASLAAMATFYDALTKGKPANEAKVAAAEAALSVASKQLPELRNLVTTGDKYDEVFLGRVPLDKIETIDPKWGPLYAYSYVNALNVKNESFDPYNRNAAGQAAVTMVSTGLLNSNVIGLDSGGKVESLFSGGSADGKPLSGLGDHGYEFNVFPGLKLQADYFLGGGDPADRGKSQAVKKVTADFKEKLAIADEHFAAYGNPTATEQIKASLSANGLPSDLFNPETSDTGLAYWTAGLGNVIKQGYVGNPTQYIGSAAHDTDLTMFHEITKELNPPSVEPEVVRALFAYDHGESIGNIAQYIYVQSYNESGKDAAYKAINDYATKIGKPAFKKKIDEMFVEPTKLDPEVAKFPSSYTDNDETFKGVYPKWSNATRYIKAVAHGDTATDAQREAVYKEINDALPLDGSEKELAAIRNGGWGDPDITLAAYIAGASAHRQGESLMPAAVGFANTFAALKTKPLLDKVQAMTEGAGQEEAKATYAAVKDAVGAAGAHVFLTEMINGLNDKDALDKVYAWDAKQVELGISPFERMSILKYLLGGDDSVNDAVVALHSTLMKAWGSGNSVSGHSVNSYDQHTVYKLRKAVPLVGIILDKIDHWKGSSTSIRKGFRAGSKNDLAFVLGLQRAAIVNPAPLFRGVNHHGYWDPANPSSRQSGLPKVGQHILISGGASFSDSKKFAQNWTSGGGYQIEVPAGQGKGFYIAPVALEGEKEWIVPHGEYEVIESTVDNSTGETRVKVKIVDQENKAIRPEVNYGASWDLSFASFNKDEEDEVKPDDEEIQAMFDKIPTDGV